MVGTMLAHYRILEKIGAGGMGEVYRAEDQNLRRHVAVKVLPDLFAGDPERLARFEREAKLLAALSHPNIAAIHGLEEAEGKRFLILELVEGETLARRLAHGPLPLEEALDVCRQIAAGLEAAHEKSIVHRDLKPSNIKVTPEGVVKILDFGLARAFLGVSPIGGIADSPTITAEMTQPGVILGTAAYMSPEQAKGKPVDKRADIWAFGCILFECLTAKAAFPGETITEVIASVIKGEPDWSAISRSVPANVTAVLRRCLQKDRHLRFHDIADARIEIDAPIVRPSETNSAPPRFSPLTLAAGAAGFLLAGLLIGRFVITPRRSAPSGPVMTTTIKVEPGFWLDGMRRSQDRQRPSRKAMAISSNGRFLVYSAIEENPGPEAKPKLYLRRLDRMEANPIAGTEGGISPFLSPDDRWVGFWADGKLKKVLIEGGTAAVLCDAGSISGASWGRAGRIVFSVGENWGEVLVVPAEGGNAEALLPVDKKREARFQKSPSWLPDGQAVLFTTMKYAWDTHPAVALLDLASRNWLELVPDAADAKYLPTGHIVFLRQGILMAVRFDPDKKRTIGQPYPVVGNVMQALIAWGGSNTGAGQFDVSGSGSLVFAEGGVLPELRNALVFVDHKGTEESVAPLLFPFQAPRLSPDGRRIVYVTQGREWRVFVYDLMTDTNSELTHGGMSSRAIWTPDGARIVFLGYTGPNLDLFSQPFDGSEPMARLTKGEHDLYPGSWASDGKTLAVVEDRPDDSRGNVILLDTASGRLTPFLNSPFDEIYPEFSPDGRWLAYVSDESGRPEVYVRPFPGPGMKHQVSNQGGEQPLWARDGKQLFYRWNDQIWAADVRADADFSTGKPRLLFEKPGFSPGNPTRSYDLSLDGRRFLMVRQEERTPAPVTEMVLVQNWFAELERFVPVKK